MQKMKGFSRKCLVGVFIIAFSAVLVINFRVQSVASQYIVPMNQAPQADAILVLGAHVRDGLVSKVLKDRLNKGAELYRNGKAAKILVSGDHGRKTYDEVNTMKTYLKRRNIPAADIFMDHAGFDTYDSIYRARDIFRVKKVIIVTQKYHLFRAVYIARKLGLEAYGVATDQRDYGRVMIKFQLREVAARVKDFVGVNVSKPRPTYLGEAIPISGDGKATDD